MKKKKYCPYQDTDYVGWDEIKVEICPIQKQITEEIEYCYYDDDYKHCPIYVLQQELQRKDNIIKAIKEELSDDNKFELFYADDNIGSVMTLGAKYYREYILDKIKEIENGTNRI